MNNQKGFAHIAAVVVIVAISLSMIGVTYYFKSEYKSSTNSLIDKEKTNTLNDEFVSMFNNCIARGGSLEGFVGERICRNDGYNYYESIGKITKIKYDPYTVKRILYPELGSDSETSFTPLVSCEDSDDDYRLHIFDKGELTATSIEGSNTYNDYCENENRIFEQYCFDGYNIEQLFNCPNGCLDGKCLAYEDCILQEGVVNQNVNTENRYCELDGKKYYELLRDPNRWWGIPGNAKEYVKYTDDRSHTNNGYAEEVRSFGQWRYKNDVLGFSFEHTPAWINYYKDNLPENLTGKTDSIQSLFTGRKESNLKDYSRLNFIDIGESFELWINPTEINLPGCNKIFEISRDGNGFKIDHEKLCENQSEKYIETEDYSIIVEEKVDNNIMFYMYFVNRAKFLADEDWDREVRNIVSTFQFTEN